MTRLARMKDLNLTYHVMLRGNEKRNIFIDDSDKNKFLDTLSRMKNKYDFLLEAYCLMNNHVHLLINDNNNDISLFMKSINVSYANYFNKKYQRVGHLFQDRFLSQIVTDDNYLIAVSAYIHNNPVKAKIVKSPEHYRWSSMNGYMMRDVNEQLVHSNRILGKFSSVSSYYDFVIKYEDDGTRFIDIEEDKILIRKGNTDYIDNVDGAIKVVASELELRKSTLAEVRKDKSLRKEIMVMLRKNSRLTLLEIGQICGGYSPSTVYNVLNSCK